MILVAALFFLFLAFGMPVAYVIGISGTAFFLQHPNLPFTMVAQRLLTQTQNVQLLAVPLFLFAGNLMNESGITKRLITLSDALTGHTRAGLAQVSLVLGTLMGGVSGSAIADAAMESRILGPSMIERGYSKGYSANVVGFAGLITATIPPGIGIILYGTVGQVSIGELFAAGLVVGILMLIFLMVTVAITARFRGYRPEREKRSPLREILKALKDSSWALFFPFLLLFGLRLGIFTPSEIGSFACIYAIIIGAFVYRELTWKKFLETIEASIRDIGAIMFIIAMSGILGYGIVYQQLPSLLTGAITSVTTNHYMVIFMIIVILIIAGMFIDGSVIILLFTPIFLPLVQQLGINPVYFGLIFCTTITMGNLTPPVGVSMYTVCSVLNLEVSEWIRETLPFILAVVLEMGVLVFVPEISLILPRLLFGQ